MSRYVIAPLLAAAVLLAAGCQAARRDDASLHRPRLGGLVTASPGALAHQMGEGWEVARNDWHVNPRPALGSEGLTILEIHTHDRLRTSNGRPRDHSRTDVHAIQVRVRR